MRNWLLGIVISLLGAIVINLGTNVVKYSHNIKQSERKNSKLAIWLFGWILFAFGNLFHFASFPFAPQSLLSAVQSFQFVVNLACARILLGEKLSIRAIFGTTLIIIGTILVAAFASHQDKEYTVKELLRLYSGRGFLIFITVLIFFVIVFSFVFFYTRYYLLRDNSKYQPIPSVYNAAKVLMPLSFSFVSASFGVQTPLIGKSIAEILKLTLFGKQNQFHDWFSYVLFLDFFVFAVIWLVSYNYALKKYDSLYIIPVIGCIYITLSIVEGGIYFQEFDNLPPFKISLFSLGVCVLIFGVYLINNHSVVSRQQQNQTQVIDNGSENPIEQTYIFNENRDNMEGETIVIENERIN